MTSVCTPSGDSDTSSGYRSNHGNGLEYSGNRSDAKDLCLSDRKDIVNHDKHRSRLNNKTPCLWNNESSIVGDTKGLYR